MMSLTTFAIILLGCLFVSTLFGIYFKLWDDKSTADINDRAHYYYQLNMQHNAKMARKMKPRKVRSCGGKSSS